MKCAFEFGKFNKTLNQDHPEEDHSILGSPEMHRFF